MKYLKKRLDEEGTDMMRINLSVRERKLSAEPVCDFCGDEHPVFVYASTRMSTGETQQCWRWCACEICSTAIDVEDWNTVESRLIRRLSDLLPSLMRGSPLILKSVKYALEDFKHYVVLNISFV